MDEQREGNRRIKESDLPGKPDEPRTPPPPERPPERPPSESPPQESPPAPDKGNNN